MAETDEQGRRVPPGGAGEAEALCAFLDFQRATFAWKTSGLNGEELARTTAASTMTLGGMMKHLALVEDWWFGQCIGGRPSDSAWAAVNFELDPDWEWHSAAENSPEQLRRLWEESVERSRVIVEAALALNGLDTIAKRTSADGRAPNLRWVMLHMIEEYARHNGHADLLRESIDGQTGE